MISAHDPAPTANRRSASTKHQAVRLDGPSNKLICELIEGHTGQAGPKPTYRTEAKLPEFAEMLLFAKSFIHATDFHRMLASRGSLPYANYTAGFYRESAVLRG